MAPIIAPTPRLANKRPRAMRFRFTTPLALARRCRPRRSRRRWRIASSSILRRSVSSRDERHLCRKFDCKFDGFDDGGRWPLSRDQRPRVER